MAGYDDTRKLIIDTLMGRPKGKEIQPEDHQTFALQITDYIRAVELVSRNVAPIAGWATENTVPVQPDLGQAIYMSQVNPGETVTFSNFFDSTGTAISVTSASDVVTLVTLIWDGQYWSKQTTTFTVTIVTNIQETYRVTFSRSDDDSDDIVSSASSDSIKTALDAGKLVYAVFESEVLHASKVNNAAATFYSGLDDGAIRKYVVDQNMDVVEETIIIT